MQIKVAAVGDKKPEQANVKVSDSTFGKDYNEALVHQVVTAYLAGARAGTKAQKNRSDVRGGGAKPWRQKGTGRARAGTRSSPLWRSGGVTFAARPQDHAQKVNKKMYQGAMRSIFSELVRSGRLMVVDDFAISAPKTKELAAKLKEMNLDQALIIKDEFDADLFLASRNLYRVEIKEVTTITPASLVMASSVIVTVKAIKAIEEWLK